MPSKLEVQRDMKKNTIFAPLKNKWLEAQPEEIVRQEFICRLVNEYGYSLEQMEQEVKLTTSSRGTGRASADIVVWKSKEEKEQRKTAFLVVELKAESLRLKVEDCYQGYNYATWSRAQLFAISNGRELQVYKTIEEKLPLQLQPVNDIPNAKDIVDANKLQEMLAKTKEFTGDEFAKLLHKCHNIIRNNDKLSPEAAFDEISKILFIKIMYERNPKQEAIFSLRQFEKLKDAWNLSRGKSEQENSYMQRLFEDVKQEFVTDKIFEENEKIKLREKSFEQIVKELEIYNLTNTSSDVKGIAFETFLGRTFRGDLGQFFTPRAVVDFMVELMDPKFGELVCDPCAGSGGFLIKTFEHIKDASDDRYIRIKQDKYREIFGDFTKLMEDEEVALSPSALQEYNKQKDEYLKRIDDEALIKEYESFLTEINKKQDEEVEYLSKKSIFGTDANPRMARVSKMNMIMHGDGHNGIHHNDGLLNVNGIFKNRFDCIFTNPPFGTTLSKDSPTVELDDKYTNEEMIKHYSSIFPTYQDEMRQVTDNFGKAIRTLYKTGEWSGQTEVLFVERCIDLLKPGGRMGIVLPEGVLNSSNLQNARDFFESKAKILLIVSLPQEVFLSSGATVKTSLVFLKKFTDEESEQYESIKKDAIAEVESKYETKLSQIDLALAKKGKEALSAAEKKVLRAERKQIEIQMSNDVKEIIKERFDYEIPLADIQKAGINSTGGEDENQLPLLLKSYAEYRVANA